ncbi:unnamed protein product [Gadus morhua 'NCC']
MIPGPPPQAACPLHQSRIYRADSPYHRPIAITITPRLWKSKWPPRGYCGSSATEHLHQSRVVSLISFAHNEVTVTSASRISVITLRLEVRGSTRAGLGVSLGPTNGCEREHGGEI